MGLPRQKSQTSTFVDAVLDALKTISRANDPQWLTNPQTREVGIIIGEYNAPKPALLVSVDLSDHMPLISRDGSGDVAFTLHIMCVVDLADHGRLLYELESDVRKAVIYDKKVASLVYGAMRQTRSAFHIDAMKASGLGVLDTQFSGKFRFNSDTL